MAKFHAQIWQFWKSAHILETAAHRAKLAQFRAPRGRKSLYAHFWNLVNGQVGSQAERQGPWASCLNITDA